MILYVHSYAAYLNCPKTRRRAGGHLLLSNKQLEPQKSSKEVQPDGPIQYDCKVPNNAISSVSESEYGSCFQNGQKSAPMQVTLHEMGHTQPATPIQVDNLCADGISNN